jgi:hypothetical protein
MRIETMEQSIFDNNFRESQNNELYNDADYTIPFFNRNNSDREYFYAIRETPEKVLELKQSFECEEAALPELQISNSNTNQTNEDDIEVDEKHSEKDQIQEIDSFTDVKNQSPSETCEELTITTPNKPQRKTKTTEFAYLLERKAFRMMRKYYKEKFEFQVENAEYKKKLPSMSAIEINTLMTTFMDQEFGQILKLLSTADYERTRDALKTIILCDRYRKSEQISEGLSFLALRNVLHKYNTRNLIEFLSDASFSFLYTHFFLKNGK